MSEIQDSSPKSENGRDEGIPRAWPIYVFFLGTFLAMLISSGISVLSAYWIEHGPTAPLVASRLAAFATEPRVLILSMWVTAATLIGSTWVATRLSRRPFFEDLGLNTRSHSPASLLIAMVGAPALGAVLEVVTAAFSVETTGTLRIIAEAISEAEGIEIPLFILGITIGPALGEELMFRGYIQPRLIARHGPTVGIAIASALFGLLHMDSLQSPLAGILGGYIGLVAYHYGSLWPAVLTHGFNNFLSVTLLFLFPDEAEQRELSFVSGGIGLVVFSYCVHHVFKVGRRTVQARSSGASLNR
jgi:membrane protease YdiL (CAAX protease family)